MPDPWDTLKLLSDPTRLRILNLLNTEELSVAELQSVLDMGQSRISSHLALLRQGNVVLDRKDGKKSYYYFNKEAHPDIRKLIESACNAVKNTDKSISDRENLERVLARRRQLQAEYFNSVAGRLGKDYCPGRSWEAIVKFLAKLVPKIDIIDLGAGEGVLAQMLAQNARSVVCVDNSLKMVQFGTALAEKNNLRNLSYIQGDIEAVPLEDRSFDLAFLSQALHHAHRPHLAIEEACRLIRPGGRLLVIDLLKHNFDKARELYADVWLGFSVNELYKLMRNAGFENVEVNVVARETREPYFETIIGSGFRAG